MRGVLAAMLAVMAELGSVEKILAAAGLAVTVANKNGPTQVVLSGAKEAIGASFENYWKRMGCGRRQLTDGGGGFIVRWWRVRWRRLRRRLGESGRFWGGVAVVFANAYGWEFIRKDAAGTRADDCFAARDGRWSL